MKLQKYEASLILICIIGGTFAGIWEVSKVLYPQVATVFYHFDHQYRAGNPHVEEHTITESMYHILGIFDKHPTWHLSIEIESYVIEMCYYNYTDVYDMIHRMVKRGQLEICLIEYSEMLGHAYPFSDYNHSAYYSERIGDQYNITHGKSVLLQEGQWYPAFYRLKPYGYTNYMADVAKFLYFGYTPDAPVYTWDLNSYPQLTPGSQSPTLNPDPIYVVNYKHIPVTEAGVYHTWLWTQDAEIQLSGENPESEEFTVDHTLAEQYEARLIALEQLGTKFMTVAEWVDFCVAQNAVQKLNGYIPETHWYPKDYRSTWRWMGDNQGRTDDGTMLANLYRTRNRILAVEGLFANSTSYLNSTEQELCQTYIDRAWQNNILAQGTDVLGLQPRDYERQYGENHTQLAIEYLNRVLQILKLKNPWFGARNQLQVNTETGQILVGNVAGLEFQTVKVITGNHSLEVLPVQVIITAVQPTTWVNYSVQYCEYRGIKFWELRVGFSGVGNWSLGGGQAFIIFNWTAETIQYSPSLLEYATVNLTRATYPENDIFLPCANGLIYANGRALVKNCSQYHTAIHWEAEQLGFEESSLHFFANYQLFILDSGYDLDTSLKFANQVNTTPIVTLTEVLIWNQ